MRETEIYGEHHNMLEVDLQRPLVVANHGEKVTDVCTAIQHLSDNGTMSKGSLLLIMLMEIRSAELAVIEAIRAENIKKGRKNLRNKTRDEESTNER